MCHGQNICKALEEFTRLGNLEQVTEAQLQHVLDPLPTSARHRFNPLPWHALATLTLMFLEKAPNDVQFDPFRTMAVHASDEHMAFIEWPSTCSRRWRCSALTHRATDSARDVLTIH